MGKPSVRRSILRIGLGIGLLLALFPAGAQAFAKGFWGPGFKAGTDPFPIFRQLGVSIVQQELNWNTVAPTPPRHATDPKDPAYVWPASLGQEISEARKFHMRILLQVVFAPAWANGGHPLNWAPIHNADFAAFVTAAARHYRGVHFWMIWGEPTKQMNFQPLYPAPWYAKKLNNQQLEAPHKYAQLLDAAYGALKAVSRANVVIGGNTFSAGDIHTKQWIENLRLPNGKPPRMDVYGHDPFGWRTPRFGVRPSYEGQVQFPDLPRLARWIDAYLGRPRHVSKPIPIFISEWNQPTAPEQEFPWWVDPPVAAKYTSDALALARHWNRILGFSWIELYDNPPFENAGLLTVDGKRKPDFYAFARG